VKSQQTFRFKHIAGILEAQFLTHATPIDVRACDGDGERRGVGGCCVAQKALIGKLIVVSLPAFRHPEILILRHHHHPHPHPHPQRPLSSAAN